MASQKKDIWSRNGATGILSLTGENGNYLDSPDFIDRGLLMNYFGEEGLKGIIIRGSGRHFSAGADLGKLRELAQDEARTALKMASGKELLQLIEGLDLPVIAEISGVCFGGGLEIALACHIRICSENALFAFPETNLGIMPGLGGSVALSRLIGPGKAAEMMLSGDVMNAAKALQLGLVDHVVPQETLHDFGMKLLNTMTGDREIEVIRSVMRSVHNALHMPFDEALKEETRMFCHLAVKNMKGT